MNIIEYDAVDPMGPLQLSLLALDFPLTPERAAHIRRTDPRPFPCLALYAVEGLQVLGQVGVFRLPVVSTAGCEDVGGIWAVSTHPEHAGRGVASQLLREAHTRMAAAGLRYSTLGTDRYRVAYSLYRQHGYVDMQVTGTALARWETAHQPTRLRAQPPNGRAHDLVEELFAAIAKGRLGFARRHTPFAPLRDKVRPEEIRVLWQNDAPVGYALTSRGGPVLRIRDLLLRDGIGAAEAVAAVAAETRTAYVQVTASRPGDMTSLRRAGYRIAHPDWSAFMVKPLVPSASPEDARRLFGIGADRFLISWLDTT